MSAKQRRPASRRNCLSAQAMVTGRAVRQFGRASSHTILLRTLEPPSATSRRSARQRSRHRSSWPSGRSIHRVLTVGLAGAGGARSRARNAFSLPLPVPPSPKSYFREDHSVGVGQANHRTPFELLQPVAVSLLNPRRCQGDAPLGHRLCRECSCGPCPPHLGRRTSRRNFLEFWLGSTTSLRPRARYRGANAIRFEPRISRAWLQSREWPGFPAGAHDPAGSRTALRCQEALQTGATRAAKIGGATRPG